MTSTFFSIFYTLCPQKLNCLSASEVFIADVGCGKESYNPPFKSRVPLRLRRQHRQHRAFSVAKQACDFYPSLIVVIAVIVIIIIRDRTNPQTTTTMTFPQKKLLPLHIALPLFPAFKSPEASGATSRTGRMTGRMRCARRWQLFLANGSTIPRLLLYTCF